jgi:lipoyl(octanoyl) transferase
MGRHSSACSVATVALLPLLVVAWSHGLHGKQHGKHTCSCSTGRPNKMISSGWNRHHHRYHPPSDKISYSLGLYMIAPQQLGSFETLPRLDMVQRPSVRCRNFIGSTSSPVDFEQAWQLQRAILDEQLRFLAANGGAAAKVKVPHDGQQSSSSRDELILLEHKPVYTLGTASDEKFVTVAGGTVPVVRMDRGGEVTYHGPGQLTAYPILNLKRYKQDIHWYVRALEEVVILALGECGLTAVREENLTGVFVDGIKVAAIGVKCKRWVTQHGLAINVTPQSLEHFDGIVPCGLEGRKVGCVQQFLVNDDSSSPTATPTTTATIDVATVAEYVKVAFEDVFQVKLIDASPAFIP